MPRSKHFSVRRPFVPLIAAALSLAACAEIEPLEKTGLYEVFTGHSATAWCQEGDEARLLEDGADLVGPDFSLSMLCHFSATEAPDHVAAESEQLADLPTLAGGVELVIDQLAFKPAQEMDAGGEEVEAWIEADGRRIDLDSLPIRGDYLAVTVPAGAETVLWVEDQGRAQGLDLRSGSQIEPVDGYYDGIDIATVVLDGWEFNNVEFSNEDWTWTVSCSDDWARANRSIWTTEHGWAPEGSAHLDIEFYWCGGEAAIEEVIWTLDVSRAVTVVSDQQYFQPVDWTVGEAEENGWQLVSVHFEVPVDTADFTVYFTPAGEVTGKDDGETYRSNGLTAITKWEVAF